MQDTAVTTIAHVIQLAVAPVFLLTGIGAMLAVMTQRLSRVVDRARVLERLLPGNPPGSPAIHEELATLSQRAKLISTAITLCTTRVVYDRHRVKLPRTAGRQSGLS